jgi:hypothetical protein
VRGGVLDKYSHTELFKHARGNDPGSRRVPASVTPLTPCKFSNLNTYKPRGDPKYTLV